jgi:hypothetical protein
LSTHHPPPSPRNPTTPLIIPTPLLPSSFIIKILEWNRTPAWKFLMKPTLTT